MSNEKSPRRVAHRWVKMINGEMARVPQQKVEKIKRTQKYRKPWGSKL